MMANAFMQHKTWAGEDIKPYCQYCTILQNLRSLVLYSGMTSYYTTLMTRHFPCNATCDNDILSPIVDSSFFLSSCSNPLTASPLAQAESHFAAVVTSIKVMAQSMENKALLIAFQFSRIWASCCPSAAQYETARRSELNCRKVMDSKVTREWPFSRL